MFNKYVNLNIIMAESNKFLNQDLYLDKTKNQ